MSRNLTDMFATRTAMRRAGLGLSLLLGFSGSAIMGIGVATASGAAPAVTASLVSPLAGNGNGNGYGHGGGPPTTYMTPSTTSTTYMTPSTTSTTASSTTTTTTTPATTTTVSSTTTTTRAATTSAGSSSPTTAVSASSSALAFTGPGKSLLWMVLVGVVLIVIGAATFVLVDAPRRLLVFLGHQNQPRWRRHSEPRDGATTIWCQETVAAPSDLWHGTGPPGLWQQCAGPEADDQRPT